MESIAPPQPAPEPYGRPIRRRRGRRILALALAAAVGLGLAERTSVSYYRVSSGSMEPTFAVGARVTIDPALRTPAVGEIVVFHAPAGALASVPVCAAGGQGEGFQTPCGASTPQTSSATFVKRVVAGPGDRVSFSRGQVIRDGRPEADPYAAPCADGTGCDFVTPVTVPPDEYYLVGDNRGDSDDSRFWGPVPRAWIIGTAVSCSFLRLSCLPLR